RGLSPRTARIPRVVPRRPVRDPRHPDELRRALCGAPRGRGLEVHRRLHRPGELRAAHRQAGGRARHLAVHLPPGCPGQGGASVGRHRPAGADRRHARRRSRGPHEHLLRNKERLTMNDVIVDAAEIDRRTIRKSDWVACNAAFIDCRTPGSDQKENYSFIGVGVSQSDSQYINLTERHGFNTGAAGMPNGISNNLHLHFTAEVFINLGGEFRLRWGVDGKQGEYVSHDGDVISIPTWIFRGFTNEGPDDGVLFTVLGRDDTGGIIWGPSVLREAESYGLHLTADNKLIDTVAGDVLPEDA